MAELIKVKFLKSPTCEPFNLAYSIGQIGEVTPEMLTLLKKEKMIEEIKSSKKKASTRESKRKTEKR